MVKVLRPEAGPPVHVNERIPIPAGTPALPPEQVAREKIPMPQHLLVGRELGQGAMGHVHPAADRNLLRRVALKRLDKDYAVDALYRGGFIAEAQVNGQLEHPNIVPVYELSIDHNGIPYFTMQLVQGISFEEWLAARPLGSTDRIEGGIEILIKICDALSYAHHRGVIHRDLKPANIMVGEFGQVYLMDWGLSKLTRNPPASGSKAMMNQEGPVGTPDFMAPEQARGDPNEMDERSDVFGLGALVWEVLAGMGPYGMHDDAMVVVTRAGNGMVMNIDEACAPYAISRHIRSVARRATEADPAKRYQTVAELKRDLRAFISGGLHLPRRSFSAGQVIVREGDRGDDAFMIIAGRCRAFRTVGGREETLAVMEPGEAFGEMALLLGEPRAATVVAVDAVTVLVLDKSTMDEGLGLSGWTGALVRALANRFADLEKLVRSSGLRRS